MTPKFVIEGQGEAKSSTSGERTNPTKKDMPIKDEMRAKKKR